MKALFYEIQIHLGAILMSLGFLGGLMALISSAVEVIK